MDDLLLSLCIPTNGVTEWVIPVLDSIYKQDVDQQLFEVVITDNGNNEEFQKAIKNYSKKVSNLVYQKTNAQGFTNQINAFNLAKGKLIKFVNHRMKIVDGGVQYLVDFVENNQKDKPYVYFSNGELKFNDIKSFNNFNDFAYELSYWLSWSAGIALWKSDYDQVKVEKLYNDLFPHLNFVFPYTHKDKYLIDNKELLIDETTDATKKGHYNLFKAFAYEFINCMKYLKDHGDITELTYNKIKNDNYGFLLGLYQGYIIKKTPCSYDLTDYKKYINIYYDEKKMKKDGYIGLIKGRLKRTFKL